MVILSTNVGTRQSAGLKALDSQPSSFFSTQGKARSAAREPAPTDNQARALASKTDLFPTTYPHARRSVCGSLVVLAQCSSDGHTFGKRLYCGKEWCQVCGKKGSHAHMRRVSRWLPKAMQIQHLGYLVIEFPNRYRKVGRWGDPDDAPGWTYRKEHLWPVPASGKYLDYHSLCEGSDDGLHHWQKVRRNKAIVLYWCPECGGESKRELIGGLVKTTDDILDVLGGVTQGRKGRVGGYYGRGLGRWHWHGDKSNGKLNPHYNVLVDADSLKDDIRVSIQPEVDKYKAELQAGEQSESVRKLLRGVYMYEHRKSGYLPAPVLEAIKVSLRAALSVPELIVHYTHANTPGQIFHKVAYVTRATFLNESWDPYMAAELHDFRNSRAWGKWKDEPAWGLHDAAVEGEDTSGLEVADALGNRGCCPDCGAPLKVLKIGRSGAPVLWTKPIVIDDVQLAYWGAENIGVGYYRMHMPECSTEGGLSPADYLRLSELEVRGKRLRSREYQTEKLVELKAAYTRRYAYSEDAWTAWFTEFDSNNGDIDDND